MSDATAYTESAFKLGSTVIPHVGGSLSTNVEKTQEFLRSGGKINHDISIVYEKKPIIKASIYDISLLDDIDHYGSVGDTYNQVSAHWRVYECGGLLGTAYHSIASDLGVLLPNSLSASLNTAATLELTANMLHTAGTAFVIGTVVQLPSVITKTFTPDTVVIGSDTIDMNSCNVNWNYGEAFADGRFEPECLYWKTSEKSGDIKIWNLNKIDAARMNGTEQSITLNFREAQEGATGSYALNLGTCFIEAEVTDSMGTVTFTKLQ